MMEGSAPTSTRTGHKPTSELRPLAASVEAFILLAQRLAVPLLIFVAVLSVYYFLNHQPAALFKHYVYQAEAFLSGSLDVKAAGMPDFYHDAVDVDGKRYLSFPPMPSVLLLPFVALWGTAFDQANLSLTLGAINVVLLWHLLGLLNISRTTKLLLVPFFAFGTVHFFAATSGTAWHYAHVSAVFFLLLAIIFLLRRAPPIIPAVLLGFAFLSREPTILAAPFFAYWLVRQRHESILNKEALLDKQSLFQAGLFAAGLVPFVAFWFWYNFTRFGGPLETGYDTIYLGYLQTNNYSFYRGLVPDAPHFNLFDVRSVPLHLYTMFLMPPQFVPDEEARLPLPIGHWAFLRPSPYGMSVLLTSPAFIYAALAKRNDVLKYGSWMAIGLISIPLLLHFSQGWFQFGYRFLLDFAPFLLILTAFGFDDNRSPAARRVQVLLVAVAILAGFWGLYWGTKLGW